MNEDAILFLKQCLQIYSPSGKEQDFSLFIADFLKKNNFKVQFDKIGNLIAEKGSGKPKILLISHLDTIPGELPIIEKERKIYGRGAVDCKSSLASMVYSISKYDFQEENSGTFTFVGIVREEDSLIGIKEFMNSPIHADYAIFGEPTKIDQFCTGYKGRLCIEFKVITESGHVASAWLFHNSITICLEIWKIILRICTELNQKYEKYDANSNLKYFNQIIPNITQIFGGELTNTVPAKCLLTVDIRFPPGIDADDILTLILNNVDNLKQIYEKNSDSTIKINAKILSLVNGYDFEGDKLIIGALRWAIFKTIKKKPKMIKKTGTTMINLIAPAKNIPSITYGPGDPKLEHTQEEYIEIEEYLKSIQIYLNFFDKIFENFKKKRQSKGN
ncbi:MAG: M20/M25/M40 family metallo-hydrolase [Promethearchaeota archaeon]